MEFIRPDTDRLVAVTKPSFAIKEVIVFNDMFITDAILSEYRNGNTRVIVPLKTVMIDTVSLSI